MIGKLLLLLLMFSTVGMSAQQLTASDIPVLVEIVSDEIDLTKKQKGEFQDVLLASFKALQQIRSSEHAELEKLFLIKQNQDNADARLKLILTAAQYEAYKLFVHGDAAATTSTHFEDKVAALADQLNLKGEKRSKFIQNLNDLESATILLLQNGYTEEVGLQLLVEILSTDIQVINTLGKATYESFFELRASGALSDAEQEETDIETVLMFYDIAQALQLNSKQTKESIKLILQNEIEKEAIRKQYRNSPAMMKDKVAQQEQQSLLNLQSILSPEQVTLFLDMVGK